MREKQKNQLILIPGLSDDAALWSHQVRHLTDVANPRVADISTSESVTAMAAEVLANAEPYFSLCGFSLGGYVALEICRQAPHRVIRLGLVGTNARADTDARRAERATILKDVEVPDGYRRILTMQLESSIAPVNLENVPLRKAIIEMGLRLGQDAFARQHRACMTRSPSHDLLSKINCPTLVVCGRQDAATPVEMSLEIATGVANSRFVVIEDAGHYVQLEQPQATTALLREWLLYS